MWRFGSPPDREADAVMAGGADWTDDTPTDATALARTYPGLIHSNAFPGERFVQARTTARVIARWRARMGVPLGAGWVREPMDQDAVRRHTYFA